MQKLIEEYAVRYAERELNEGELKIILNKFICECIPVITNNIIKNILN